MKEIILDGNATDLSKLEPFLLKYTTSASVIFRDETSRLSPYGAAFLKAVDEFVLEVKAVSAWPGTELLDGKKAVEVSMTVNQKSFAVLKKVGSRLGNFIEPNLPEDLCFYRDDNSVLLTSISHENDFYLTLSQAELSLWKELGVRDNEQ